MRTWAPRWGFFVLMAVGAAVSGYSAVVRFRDASAALFVAFAATLPLIDRELRRRETADREWSAQRPRGGR